jgi:hypothetical protein
VVGSRNKCLVLCTGVITGDVCCGTLALSLLWSVVLHAKPGGPLRSPTRVEVPIYSDAVARVDLGKRYRGLARPREAEGEFRRAGSIRCVEDDMEEVVVGRCVAVMV